MKFNEFLKEEQLSIARFSKQTGLNEATVTKWKYNGVIPRKPEMLVVYKFTQGRVQPNDFYGIGE